MTGGKSTASNERSTNQTVNCENCDGQNLADVAEQRGYCYNCSFPLEAYAGP